MAGRDAAGAPRRPRFHLQVEHGLDARHARLHDAGSRPPQVAPQQDHVLADVRLQRAVRAAVLARRGGARQALDARQDARRRVAEARRPARALRLHVRAPGQEAAVHGRRDRAVARVESRRRARLGGARRSARTPALQRWVRDLNASTPASRRCGRTTVDPRGFRGSTATTTSTASSRCCAAATPATRWCAVVNFTPVPRPATASACRAPARIAKLLNSDAAVYGGSNVGNGGPGHRAPSRSPRTATRSRSALTVPPLGFLLFSWSRRRRRTPRRPRPPQAPSQEPSRQRVQSPSIPSPPDTASRAEVAGWSDGRFPAASSGSGQGCSPAAELRGMTSVGRVTRPLIGTGARRIVGRWAWNATRHDPAAHDLRRRDRLGRSSPPSRRSISSRRSPRSRRRSRCCSR